MKIIFIKLVNLIITLIAFCFSIIAIGCVLWSVAWLFTLCGTLIDVDIIKNTELTIQEKVKYLILWNVVPLPFMIYYFKIGKKKHLKTKVNE